MRTFRLYDIKESISKFGTIEINYLFTLARKPNIYYCGSIISEVRDKKIPYGKYYIIEFEEETPIGCHSMLIYYDDFYMVDYPEKSERLLAGKAFNKDFK